MPSKKQIVDHSEESEPSEPPRIEDFKWDNKCHAISAIARLVDAVYILRYEPEGSQDPALPCLDDFGFKLIDRLIDKNDESIFGAIFEYKGKSLSYIPQFVIAFRGTKLKSETWVQDIKLDAKCMANTTHNSSRLQHAMNSVRKMVTSRASGASVWLAGHSLGAAIALLVGKQMCKEGHFLETYLFNPPFCSDLITGRIKSRSVNFWIQLTKNFVKLIVSSFEEDHQGLEAQANDAFDALSNWVPHIFVHPDDPVCSAYIHYFQNRQKMLEFGLRNVEKIAARRTMRMVLGIDSSSEAMHLLPSAILTINKFKLPRKTKRLLDKIRRMKSAHELRQWLNPNSSHEVQVHIHKYSPPN